MRRATLSLVAGLVLALLIGSSWAVAQTAQPSARPAPAASAAGSAAPPPSAAKSAAPATSTSAALPPGHPPTDAMPPGHPPTDAMPPGHPPTNGGTPPGHPPAEGSRRIPDRVMPDDKLPPGTVEVIILDGNDQPVPNAPIVLNVLFSSVTKGDSRETLPATTDASGRYRFEQLKHGMGISYRLTTQNGPATFGTQPFGLTDQFGIRVIQHRYDIVTSLAESEMLLELILLLDIKQDNVAINHLLRAFNRGTSAYVATDIRIPFPKDYEGFDAQESSGDVAMKDVEGHMVLTGTFPPGQTDLTYRYQLPLGGGADLDMKVPLPPRMAITHVVLKANDEMTLKVAGFPPAEESRWNDGAKVQQTSKVPQTMTDLQAVMGQTAPGQLEIEIDGIPTPGLKRTLAVLLTALALSIGAVQLFRRREQQGPAPDLIEDLEQAQAALLDELALLEKLRSKGEVGPRTYEGLRAQLLDALARIMARLEAAMEASGRPEQPSASKKKTKQKRRRDRARARA